MPSLLTDSRQWRAVSTHCLSTRVPVQSPKLFQAIRGMGGTTRLVMLPRESHGYRARESILHMLHETHQWLETHVRNAPPRAQKAAAR